MRGLLTLTTLALSAPFAVAACIDGGAEMTEGADEHPDGLGGGDAVGDSGEDAAADSGAVDTPVPNSCATDLDCTPFGLVCDPLTKTCVECLFGTDCPSNFRCLPSRECAPYTSCGSSLDCTDQVCEPQFGFCVDCIDDEDCDQPAHCFENACASFTPCQTSLDCANQVCGPLEGECVDCLTDADCGESAHCTGLTCVPYIACDSDLDCTPLGQLCDKTIGECARCLAHKDCPDQYHCSAGACLLDVCAQGQGTCNGNVLAACNEVGDGFGSPSPCGAEQTCVVAGMVAKCEQWLCAPGKSCEGDLAVNCSDDGLEVMNTTDCASQAKVCVNGGCEEQVCVADTTFCEDQVVMACVESGTGKLEVSTCGAGTYCAQGGGTASCEPQVCAPGSLYCEATWVMQCDPVGSSGSQVTNCGDQDENCFDGECKDQLCEPNSTYCAGAIVMECDAAGTTALEVTTCGEGTYCDDGEGTASCESHVCVPNQPTCIGNSVTTCNAIGSGPVGGGSPCGELVCLDGVCSDPIGTPAAPAVSCNEVLLAGASKGDGVYWLDPDGIGILTAPFEAYCDMTTDGGGWTVIARFPFNLGPDVFPSQSAKGGGLFDNDVGLPGQATGGAFQHFVGKFIDTGLLTGMSEFALRSGDKLVTGSNFAWYSFPEEHLLRFHYGTVELDGESFTITSPCSGMCCGIYTDSWDAPVFVGTVGEGSVDNSDAPPISNPTFGWVDHYCNKDGNDTTPAWSLWHGNKDNQDQLFQADFYVMFR